MRMRTTTYLSILGCAVFALAFFFGHHFQAFEVVQHVSLHSLGGLGGFGLMIGALNGAPDLQGAQASGADATPGGVIRAQFKRQLPTQTWVAGGQVSVNVPVDDVYKRLFLRLNGSFSVTFAAGAPEIGGMGVFPRLVTNILIQQNGQDTIKNVDPFFMRMFDTLVNGEPSRRAVTKQAGAFTTTRIPLTEMEYGGSAYQATTGFMLVEESLSIYFEHPLAYEFGKSVSLWNCRGLATATIVMQFGQYSNLDDAGATVTYAADIPITIDLEMESAPAVPREQDFLIFKQSSATYSYSSQTSAAQIQLPRGNLITGVHLIGRNGDANGRRLSDAVVTNILVELNGQRSIKKTTWRNAQEEMKIAFGIRDPRSTAAQGITHILQGYCYLGFIRDGIVATALDSSLAKGVDSVALKIDTASATGVDPATYTNPVLVSVMTDELSPPVKRFA